MLCFEPNYSYPHKSLEERGVFIYLGKIHGARPRDRVVLRATAFSSTLCSENDGISTDYQKMETIKNKYFNAL